MKKVFILTLLSSLSFCNAQYVKAKQGETNYKEGFSYYEHGRIDVKITLLKWDDRGMDYEWRTKVEVLGTTTYGWTDDEWIDLNTDKAFYNNQTHEIIYYDEVDIITKKI
jgi:hypothetical protein